jgi:hypothetical protein
LPPSSSFRAGGDAGVDLFLQLVAQVRARPCGASVVAASFGSPSSAARGVHEAAHELVGDAGRGR